MRKKRVSALLLTVFFPSMLTLAFGIQPVRSEPTTWTVDDDGQADFATIQGAISSSLVAEGDTIFVHSGTYYESVVVNKTVSLIGENWNTTVVKGVMHDPKWQSVIAIRSDFVTMANFTVTNGLKGIYIRGRRSTVTDCVAYENGFGLVIDPNIAFGYSTNVLRRNQLFNNTYNLLVVGSWYFNDYVQDIDSSNLVNGKPVYYLVNEENISITPETYPNIGYLGIVGSTNVQIANLSLSRNGDGLLVAFSQNTLIENVEVTYNYFGMCLKKSPQTIVNHCNLSYNFQGAFMYYSDNGKIEENRISHNEAGIFLMGSNNNEICHNDLVENSPYNQARFYMSANNQIYHNNFICDTQQAYIETQGYANSWDDGYPSGGNYWSDYEERYPNATEINDSGIWDTPYVIDENNQDNYPIMNPRTLSPPIPPPPPITATVDVNPDTLNLKSKGRWITVHIELPEGYNVSNIDRSTILLNDTIPVDSFWLDKSPESVIGDYDNDGITDLMVKFDRAKASEFVLAERITDGYVTLSVAGEVDGTLFEGTDTMRVFDERRGDQRTQMKETWIFAPFLSTILFTTCLTIMFLPESDRFSHSWLGERSLNGLSTNREY